MPEKVMNPLKYELQVTERHLHLIKFATELACFLLFGKLENPLWQLWDTKDVDPDKFSEACEMLKKIVFPELGRNSNYGVGWSENKPYLNKAQIFYEIEAMIAHELWKRNPNAPKGTVASGPPLHYSDEELLRITGVIEEIQLLEARS